MALHRRVSSSRLSMKPPRKQSIVSADRYGPGFTFILNAASAASACRNVASLCVCECPPPLGEDTAVNYWMQKCDPALMHAERDDQEASDYSSERGALCFRRPKCIHYPPTTPGPFLMPRLAPFYAPPGRLNIYIYIFIHTQHKGPLLDLTAVHEAPAGLAVLVWLRIDTNRHKYSRRGGAGTSEGERYAVGYHAGRVKETSVRPSCRSHFVSVLLVMLPPPPPRIPRSEAKSSARSLAARV